MDERNWMIFSKHLQGVPLEQAAAWVRAIGMAAVDVTVRHGGHVEPANVSEQLPACAQMLARHGVRIGMISTDIVDAADPISEGVLREAVQLGVRHYKMGYFRYGEFGSLRRQRADVAARLKDLAALNRQIGIRGGYHNHSDDFFGASVWEIDAAMESIDPADLGICFDPAHAVIEGGSAGWRMALDLIAPRLAMLAVKDFRWVEGKHRYAGGRRHSVEFCPLESGNTPWPQVIRLLESIGFDGPVSFHSEYQGSHSFRDLSSFDVVQQAAADVRQFRLWANAG